MKRKLDILRVADLIENDVLDLNGSRPVDSSIAGPADGQSVRQEDSSVVNHRLHLLDRRLAEVVRL